MSFSKAFIDKNISSLDKVDTKLLDKMVSILVECKNKNGRLFLVGVGGSAGHCSHAVNDFRKICNVFIKTGNHINGSIEVYGTKRIICYNFGETVDCFLKYDENI